MLSEASALGDGTLFQLEGQFGLAEAQAVHELLSQADRGTRLTIDFSKVGVFQDIAIGALANSVMKCPATVALRGLATHQRRLLRYLGVETELALAGDAQS
jgi:anti-anti-sigma regulatory factor